MTGQPPASGQPLTPEQADVSPNADEVVAGLRVVAAEFGAEYVIGHRVRQALELIRHLQGEVSSLARIAGQHNALVRNMAATRDELAEDGNPAAEVLDELLMDMADSTSADDALAKIEAGDAPIPAEQVWAAVLGADPAETQPEPGRSQ